MTTGRPKVKVIIKSSKRFLINKEDQELQQKIFETFDIWTTARLIDEVYLSLMSIKSQFCMLVGLTKEIRARDPKNHGSGVIRRLYEEQARYKMYRMPLYRPSPIFFIHLKDLDGKVKQELLKHDMQTRYDVLRQAVERIFETVDSRFFLLSAKQFLNVRLVEGATVTTTK